MRVDEKEFFREAALRICSSLDISKAMQTCLKYFSQFIPAQQLSFHIYDREIGIVETVAIAGLTSRETLALRTPLSAKGRKQVEAQRSMRIKYLKRLGDDAVTGPVVRQLGAENLPGLILDLALEKEFIGTVAVLGSPDELFTEEHMHLFSLINEPFAIALANCLRYRELQSLRDMLADDNRYLQHELRQLVGSRVIGAEFGLKSVMEQIRQVAPLKSPVLLLGETGSGKEVIANAVHYLSPRKNAPFIRVNCGAIPQSLMDSELFGHEKGAFTGASLRKRGRFERANGGTIFLDEIGELPLEAQVRLLRVLQEKEIERVGGSETIQVDIRVIAATHRNLEQMLSEGKFREDLYFRLRVFPILIPPLRHRTEDIPALVEHFVRKKAREIKLSRYPSLAAGALERLMRYRWPGNVRELENAVERALITNKGGALEFADIGSPMRDRLPVATVQSAGQLEEITELDMVITHHIQNTLERCHGRIEGEKGAAKLLKINPSTLRKRMRKLGIPFGGRQCFQNDVDEKYS
ncbi:MAG: sigma-54 dependent transcriptional regulator [Pseudomonadota bacterium]